MPGFDVARIECFGDTFFKQLVRGVRACDAFDELCLFVGRAYSERCRGACTPKNYIMQFRHTPPDQGTAGILRAIISVQASFILISILVLWNAALVSISMKYSCCTVKLFFFSVEQSRLRL